MAAEVIPTIERMGIHPKFPRVKAFLKLHDVDHTIAQEVDMLTRYVTEGSGFSFSYQSNITVRNDVLPREYRYEYNNALGELAGASNQLRSKAIVDALDGRCADWFENWKRSVAYGYWRDRLMASPSFQQGIAIAADCLILGWYQRAIELVKTTCMYLEQSYFSDGKEKSPSRISYFIVRLIGDWQGWPVPDGPKWAFDEPLYNALIAHWRTPDPSDLAPLLLAALDRRTHQTKRRSHPVIWDNDNSDFWYDPFEVLAIFRLRQMHGLENPVLDHLLMNTPFGKLPEPSEPYTDELLDGVLAEMRKEVPERFVGVSF